jgi:hypothetical protein
VRKDALNGPRDFLQQSMAHEWDLEVAVGRANHSTETAHVKESRVQSGSADLIAVRFGDAFDQATQTEAAQLVRHPARLQIIG